MAKIKKLKVKINMTPEFVEEAKVELEKASAANYNLPPAQYRKDINQTIAEKQKRLEDDSQVVEIEYDEQTALGRPYNSLSINGMDYTFIEGHTTKVLTEDYKAVMKIIKS